MTHWPTEALLLVVGSFAAFVWWPLIPLAAVSYVGYRVMRSQA